MTDENAEASSVVPTARRLRKPRVTATPIKEVGTPADVMRGTEADEDHAKAGKLHDITSHLDDAPPPKRSRVQNNEAEESPM